MALERQQLEHILLLFYLKLNPGASPVKRSCWDLQEANEAWDAGEASGILRESWGRTAFLPEDCNMGSKEGTGRPL